MAKINRADFENMKKEELVNKLVETLIKVARYEDEPLTREQVAERLQKSVSWVDKCRANGTLKPNKHDPSKRNSAVWYPLSQIIDFMHGVQK